MIAARIASIEPFVVMEVLEKALELESQGRSIIHMEIGEPDFDTPEVIVRAARAALREGKTKYTHSLGLGELRQAIAARYNLLYGLSIDWRRVIITMGSSPGMLVGFGAILDATDEVILSDPGYPCYANFVKFMEGVVSKVDIRGSGRFEYDLVDVERAITPRTKAIVVTSPSNPTGGLVSEETLTGLAALGTNERLIVSDEIYHGMVYEGKEHSILEYTDNAIVVNGFSKLYAMTGWRLGYLIVPPALVRPIQKLQQNFFISPNSFVQWAGLAALKEAEPDVKTMIATYDERRKYLLPRLEAIGFRVPVKPVAAFYMLADCSAFDTDSYRFVMRLLDETGVALTPGTDFGASGEGFVRFSYATDMENIKEGCRRLEGYLNG